MQRLRKRLKKHHPEPHPPQEVTLVTDLSHPQLHTGVDSSPPETLPAPHFPDGVKVLHDCPDATVDICFVHGLTGDRENTWTANGQSAPWPETLLPPRLKKARILTYGYDAYIVRASVASANRLNDHAKNFLVKLTANRALNNASHRALIFVAHSLGGLVCKEAILLSRNSPELHLRQIFSYILGVVFMGTPHKGAWMAKWASIPVSALGLVKSVNKPLLEILDTKNQYLESIHSRFVEMLRQRQIDGNPLGIACFLEELPLPVAGLVVSKESAILDGFTSATIHADHRNMVRFATAEEDGFQLLLAELIRWVSQASQVLSMMAETCLKSLAFPEMQTRFYDLDGAVTGTCEWLHRHEAYRGWTASAQGLLWIKGKPGSGKSTLVKYALDNHRASASTNAVVLSFFFHGRGDGLQRTPLGLFRSLVHQSLSQAPNELQNLTAEFETKRKEYGDEGRGWHWHEAELRLCFESFLWKVLSKSRSVWLFIDALDECGEDNAVKLVRIFQSLLSRSSQRTGPGHLRICFSCRHYPILNLDEGGFEICAETENQSDIATFVNGQLAAFRVQSSPIPALITERASGVFMWARLVVEHVLSLDREGVGLKKIQAAVHHTPPDLDVLYWQLIQGMGPASLKLVQWICFATKPLTLDEWRWAMVIEGDCPYQSMKACQDDEDYVSDDVRMKRQVQTLSRGLAEVTKTEHIQFIHQSVKDFFVEKGLPALDGSTTPTEAALSAHFRLAKICVRSLAMEEVGRLGDLLWPITDQPPSSNGVPFLRYAVMFWAVHAQQCDDSSIPQEDFLALFAWPSNALVRKWLHHYRRAPSTQFLDIVSKRTNLLHSASRYGLSRLLTLILERTGPMARYIDARDGRGRTPLSWAAGEGHETEVTLLLGTGRVDAETKCGAGLTPLSWAAMNGREAVVKLLLSTARVDADARCYFGRTPLSWAAVMGHETVVRLLLSTGKTDANTKDDRGRTPLSGAAAAGQEAVVRALLSIGKVDGNLTCDSGRTPLSHAAECGQEAVAELLLSTGVDADTKCNTEWTPLHWAAVRGHRAVVQLLLSTGKVDAEAQDNGGQTPLSLAAERGRGTVVELLLDVGKVNVDTKDDQDRTPLSWAAMNGHEAVVNLLLGTNKVDTETKDTFYHLTPLLWAADGGQVAVVKALLQTGTVDVEARDGIFGDTPLVRAVRKGHTAVVRLLLCTGKVDVNSQDDTGRTPLSWAAEAGKEDVIKLLLATGKVDLEAEDSVHHRTPWAWASEKGHAHVLELLEPAK